MVRAGDRVLDVGTGSGILAILAAKLGAGSVIGLDNDALAVDVAGQNIERNGVQGQVEARLASLLPDTINGCGREPELFDSSGKWRAAFDLVLMNILADVISRSARAISDCLNSEGRFVLAGIIESQEGPLRRALSEVGLRVTTRRKRKDWIALYGRKASKGEPR
jgi:ribosomal protein L11 methyltransferase